MEMWPQLIQGKRDVNRRTVPDYMQVRFTEGREALTALVFDVGVID